MNGYEAMRDWYKGRIAALEAENAELKERWERALSEAREDKARLDYLESLKDEFTVWVNANHMRSFAPNTNIPKLHEGETVRAAIDAARKEAACPPPTT